jgi:NAD-dependent DNA ligase
MNFDSLESVFNGSATRKKLLRNTEKLSSYDVYDIVRMAMIPGCGGKHAKAIANIISGIETETSGLTRSVIESATTGEYRSVIDSMLAKIKSFGTTIQMVKPEQIDTTEYGAYYEMTGSPSPLFRHKEDFIKATPMWKHTSLGKDSVYLITDDLESTTGKMKKAAKLGITIVTYEQAINIYKKWYGDIKIKTGNELLDIDELPDLTK